MNFHEFMKEFIEECGGEDYLLYGSPTDELVDGNDLYSYADSLVCVEQYGGEGQGDEIWAVYKVNEDGVDKYYKVEGWYASYEGASYSEYYEVEPKQVVVTKYMKK